MKVNSFLLIVLFGCLSLNIDAQISTPNGTVSTTTNPSTGNVGIGTSTPNSKLEVVGGLKATKAIFPGKELNDEVFADWNDGIEKSIVFAAGKTVPGSLNKRLFTMHDLSMSSPYDFNGVFFNMRDRAGKERFNVLLYEGYGAILELKDNNQAEIFKISGDNASAYLQMPKANTKVIIGGYSDNPIIGTHKFVVRGSSLIEGNIITDSSIGIGTSSFTEGNDTYKLSVKGKVRAEEVKVYNTWADYVFFKNYDLLTLKEVENFILENGHLPNVPSAEEIIENGLELGEMSKIQQEKIEELTLYVIQQNKTIEKQNKEIEELKVLVKTLIEKG